MIESFLAYISLLKLELILKQNYHNFYFPYLVFDLKLKIRRNPYKMSLATRI